jgi:hypothetical protein
MSGYPADTRARHGIAESRVEFLRKPFEAEELAATVLQVLGDPG